MFATENEFSIFFTAKLNKYGMRTTRIESHTTGNGIPDLYIDGHGFDCFIELKNDKKLSVHDKTIKVQWRPGQQAWMYEYFLKHRRSKCCLTIIACSDGWFIIPMTSIFKQNIIYNADNFSISNDDLKHVTLGRLLDLMTTYFSNNTATYRDMINAMVTRFYTLKNAEIDYDPEVLWNSKNVDDVFDSGVFEAAKIDMFLTLENTLMNVD